MIFIRHTDIYWGFDFQESHLAVDLFFLLSGVVIDEAYRGRLERGLSLAAFLRLRFARLFPFYLVGTIAGILLAAVETQGGLWPFHLHNLALIFLGIAMLPNVFAAWNALPYPYDNPGWSLFAELVANYMYGLRRWPKWLMRGIVVAGAMWIIAALALFGNLDKGWRVDTFWVGIARAAFSFFLGVLLHRMPRRQIGAVWGIIIIGGVAGILTAHPSPKLQPFFEAIAVLLIFPTLIYFALGVDIQAYMERFCRLCGNISYPLYILHYPSAFLIYGAFKHAVDIHLSDYAPWGGIVLFILLVVVIQEYGFRYEKWLKALILG